VERPCARGGRRILLRVEVAVTVSAGSNSHGLVDKLLQVCSLLSVSCLGLHQFQHSEVPFLQGHTGTCHSSG